MIGGWRDGYTNPPFRLMESLDAPRKLLMGPWHHAVPDAGIPGPRIDYLKEVVRWLDHWCKNEDNGVMDRRASSTAAALRPSRRGPPGHTGGVARGAGLAGR